MAKKKFTATEGKKIVNKGAKRITAEDVEKVLQKKREIEYKFEHAGPLGRFVADVKLFFSLVRDYMDGSYKKIPFWVIAAIVFALLFVLNPFDLIPDFIPIVGYIDDAAVVAGCLALVDQQLQEYKKWKLSNSQ
ncbi:MAG: YkvA family protein [Candidatus Aminicenantes bacterium]|nr:YkvA family protein [Candidatus Aminicenantes bacterium]